MVKLTLGLGLVLGLGGCTAAQLATPQGQLFCAVQTQGGGTIVAGLVDATATTASQVAAPLVVIATGATKAFVDAACGAAGGVAVAPPANSATAPQIAVVPPKATP